MRTNTSTRTRYYDSMELNGWLLKFEYETENGALLPIINVNGVKNQSSTLLVRKDVNEQLQAFFSRSPFDSIVVAGVLEEFDLIAESFSKLKPE